MSIDIVKLRNEWLSFVGQTEQENYKTCGSYILGGIGET